MGFLRPEDGRGGVRVGGGRNRAGDAGQAGVLGGAESLYIPLDALADDPEGAEHLLGEFAERVRPRPGEAECAGGRARIVVPEEGCRRIASLPVSPVLRAMVDAVNSTSLSPSSGGGPNRTSRTACRDFDTL